MNDYKMRVKIPEGSKPIEERIYPIMEFAMKLGIRWTEGQDPLDYIPEDKAKTINITFTHGLARCLSYTTKRYFNTTVEELETKSHDLWAKEKKKIEAEERALTARIIGYKKVWMKTRSSTGEILCSKHIVAKIKIPTFTRRLISPGKCRAEKAIILGYFDLDHTKIDIMPGQTIFSLYDNTFIYPSVGGVVAPEQAFCTSSEQCASGIHFFRTFKEAKEY